MSEQLMALDATFLELEDQDPSAHMHIGGILVFGPRPDGSRPGLDELRDFLGTRIGVLPRYSERLEPPHLGRLSRPHWVRDEHFDIARHVGHAALSEPAGWEELLEWSADYYSQRLERTAPLWHMVQVDGLADGHWALVTKTHHCLVDGVGSVDAAYLLLETDPSATPAAPEPAVEPEPEHERHLPAWLPAGAVVHGARAGLHLMTHPSALQDVIKRSAALAQLVVEDELHAAPQTSLNEPIGARRRLAVARISLEEAKLVKTKLGGTVNDVVLAAVTGGLRALLLHRGEEPPAQGLRAMVPVNQRTIDETGALGNRVSSLFVNLPVAEENPIARYEAVVAAARARKQSSEQLGTDSMLRLSGVMPPVLHAELARAMYGRRLFNVTVTNVPGPQVALYLLGAPLKTVWPLVPLAAEHAVGIAVMSYAGQLTFGINADADAAADVEILASGAVDELAYLQRLSHSEAVSR